MPDMPWGLAVNTIGKHDAYVNVWQEFFASNFDQALRQLGRALRDCPDEL